MCVLLCPPTLPCVCLWKLSYLPSWIITSLRAKMIFIFFTGVSRPPIIVCLIEWVEWLPSPPLVQVCCTRSSEHNSKGRKGSTGALRPLERGDPGATKDEILFIGLATQPCGAFCVGSQGDFDPQERSLGRWVKEVLLPLSCHQEMQDLLDRRKPSVWGVGRTWKSL